VYVPKKLMLRVKLTKGREPPSPSVGSRFPPSSNRPIKRWLMVPRLTQLNYRKWTKNENVKEPAGYLVHFSPRSGEVQGS
jgi:hypothetical protein